MTDSYDNREQHHEEPQIGFNGSDSEKMDHHIGDERSLDSLSLSKEIKKPIGVRKIEVISKQYGLTGKIVVFFSVFLISYAYGLDGMTRTVFQTYATNSYGNHSLLATINVVKSVVAAASQPAIARLSDVFGRVSLLIISILFYAVGTIIQSQAYDIQRFAGGAVIYQVGYTGLMLLMELIVADFSFLNWRLVCSFVPALPFIINTWISGNITEAMGEKWSWGIGMWAIILPVVSLPLIVCFFHMIYRARRSPEWEQFKHEKTDFKHLGFKKWAISLFWKLDVVGVLLMSAVLALILVPLTLAGGVQSQWQQAKTIVPLVLGFCCIPAFVFWELKCPFPVTPFKLLKDRGVWSALIIGVLINLVWYMQGDYMYTVLVVSVNQSAASATRITSLYSFVSVITGTILGLIVVRLRRVKMFIIFGTWTWVLAMGLLVKYRGNDGAKDGIIGSLCLLGFGAGLFTYPTQVSIQACTKHEHMAVITALYLTMYNIGSGIGGAISGALWTQVLPGEINQRISDPTIAGQAYSAPLTFVLTYTWDTPERQEVVQAYLYIQKLLTIVGVCFTVPLVIIAFFTRDHKLENTQSLEKAEVESTMTGASQEGWKEKLGFKFKA